MNQVLVYSRKNSFSLQASLELLCSELNQIGFNVEQTHSTHIARLLLNPYQVVHLFVENWPLTISELFLVSFAKAIGRATVVSVFNNQLKLNKPLAQFFCPDAITVSQTNYMQYFRDWNCTKAVFPLFPILTTSKNKFKNAEIPSSFLIPLEKNLEEVFLYPSDHTVYFDARSLTENRSSSELRKTWNQFLKLKKIKDTQHLILSEEKLQQLLADEKIMIVLASPLMKHIDFTNWLQLSLNQGHLIILNEFQATGFSQSWTSGQNCLVVSTQQWPKSIQTQLKQIKKANTASNFKTSELIEPLINELSRLYTKIIHQKTSLLSTDSAKINL